MNIENQIKVKKIIFKPDINIISLLNKTSTDIKSDEQTEFLKFFNSVSDKVDLLYLESSSFPSSLLDKLEISKKNIKILSHSNDSDYILLDDLQQLERNDGDIKSDSSKMFGLYQKINSNEDIEYLKELSHKGITFVIIEVDDWKIIPLENLIAMLQKTGIEIFASAKSIDEVETLFTVLELGIDGVIISNQNEAEIVQIHNLIRKTSMKLGLATIKEIKDIGIGERVCIDTVSMLTHGEGMLVGNKSNFLFLVHNESIGSSFTSPRPFRVNAGAVHCYTITPDGKTKYLSELESGSKVLIVNDHGESRAVSVGRAKIETRPLRLFKAISDHNDQEIGTVIVQNAETIRFIMDDGKILPVTHAKIGDKIIVYSTVATGRHFGMEVSDEYILEK